MESLRQLQAALFICSWLRLTVQVLILAIIVRFDFANYSLGISKLSRVNKVNSELILLIMRISFLFLVVLR